MLITSKDNPNIKLYIKLSTSKKTRCELGQYALEGARIVADALAEGYVDSIFMTEQAMEKYAEILPSELVCGKLSERKIFEIPQEIAEKMSETKGTQGVFAIAQKLDKCFNSDTIKDGAKFVVLNNLQDPGNIGTILRTADAVGVDGVVMTDDCCDLYNPKTVRATMGSMLRLNIFAEQSFENVINTFKSCGVKTLAAVVDKEAKNLLSCDFCQKSAVVIGNEGAGLSKSDADLCDEKITIKMNGNINSLNAAMAAGIILWEMTK